MQMPLLNVWTRTMNMTKRNAVRRMTTIARLAPLRRKTPALLAIASSLALPMALPQQPVRADEFATVPAGDALYRHLAVVAKTGWAGAPGQSTPGSRSGERNPAGIADTTLTRYEIALETAKAIVTVTARHEANPAWASGVSKPALRALRELTAALRVELKSLGVDAAAALRLCDVLLKSSDKDTGPETPAPAPARVPDAASGAAMSLDSGAFASRGGAAPPPSPDFESQLRPSLSQRLRVMAAVSGVERDASDPFGDEALGVGSASSFNSTAGAARGAGNSAPRGVSGSAGAALGVKGWLTLRAAYGRNELAPSRLPMQNVWTPGAREQRTLGGGLDIALRPGMTLSGGVESIATDAAGRPSWMRVSGGVGLSAWQNRLSLKANLSRLVPEDARVLPSTMAGFNVGLGLGERLRLNLLYQQMFSAPSPARTERLVAGGISVNF